MSLDKADIGVLGEVKKVIVEKDDTILMGGNGEEADLKERIEQISQAIQNTTSEYDKEKLQEICSILSFRSASSPFPPMRMVSSFSTITFFTSPRTPMSALSRLMPTSSEIS
eukprot:TRINITY_DN12807_c0_g1_i1.p2 TRINITY_DN12807_c0_g1~~TRINITY_DN12807_c0_g1_i1.p2  ORF type:complete len:112 (-),score=21.50 TRINITY_DN12807_c0_g1_i1:18-353(-)